MLAVLSWDRDRTVRRVRGVTPASSRAEYREFSIDVVLSVTTGRMLADPDRVRDLIAWMTNGDERQTVYFNQALLTCAWFLNRQHPALSTVVVPPLFGSTLLVRHWVVSRMAMLGSSMRVYREPEYHTFTHSYSAAKSLELNGAPVVRQMARKRKRVETARISPAYL